MRVSVVIPTLNAAATLPVTLRSLAGVDDVVVADGGSVDATRRIAADHGARVMTLPPGRGGQISAGITAARHPWVLVLHADTRLQDGWLSAVRDHMSECGKAAYFRFGLDSSHWRAGLLRRAVALRCRVFALPYGDQGLLIHRTLLAAVGGMRDIPLMEDVDLVRRLGRRRLVCLEAVAVTAADRWKRDGWTRRSARNLFCLLLYCLGVKPTVIGRFYE